MVGVPDGPDPHEKAHLTSLPPDDEAEARDDVGPAANTSRLFASPAAGEIMSGLERGQRGESDKLEPKEGRDPNKD